MPKTAIKHEGVLTLSQEINIIQSSMKFCINITIFTNYIPPDQDNMYFLWNQFKRFETLGSGGGAKVKEDEAAIVNATFRKLKDLVKETKWMQLKEENEDARKI